MKKKNPNFGNPDYLEGHSETLDMGDLDIVECPNCGKGLPETNSSGEIICENCGFDETNDVAKLN